MKNENQNLIDENFEGSIFEALGFDRELCPHCKAHLKDGLCLNGCKLPGYLYRKLVTLDPTS